MNRKFSAGMSVFLVLAALVSMGAKVDQLQEKVQTNILAGIKNQKMKENLVLNSDQGIIVLYWESDSQTLLVINRPAEGWYISVEDSNNDGQLEFGLLVDAEINQQLVSLFAKDNQDGLLEKNDFPATGWNFIFSDLNGDGKFSGQGEIIFQMPRNFYKTVVELYQKERDNEMTPAKAPEKGKEK